MPPSIEISTFTIFEYLDVALPVKIMFSLAVGFSPKLLQVTCGFSVGVDAELTGVVGVELDSELGQLPQSAEQTEQFSFSDPSQIPFPQLGMDVGVGPTVGAGVPVGMGVGSGGEVGTGVGVSAGVGFGVGVGQTPQSSGHVSHVSSDWQL